MIRLFGQHNCFFNVLQRCYSAGVGLKIKDFNTEKQKVIFEDQTEDTKEKPKSQPSERYLKFKEKLRSDAPVLLMPKGMPHPAHEKEPLPPWPNSTNPHTGEVGGPRGLEPTRYGDWQSKGRVTDF